MATLRLFTLQIHNWLASQMLDIFGYVCIGLGMWNGWLSFKKVGEQKRERKRRRNKTISIVASSMFANFSYLLHSHNKLSPHISRTCFYKLIIIFVKRLTAFSAFAIIPFHSIFGWDYCYCYCNKEIVSIFFCFSTCVCVWNGNNKETYIYFHLQCVTLTPQIMFLLCLAKSLISAK